MDIRFTKMEGCGNDYVNISSILNRSRRSSKSSVTGTSESAATA